MPVHNVGYRAWTGHKTPQWTRWWIIANTGINLAFKSKWVRRLLFFAWLPVLYWAIAFFVLEKGLSEQTGFLIQRISEEAGADGQPLGNVIAAGIREQFPALPKIDVLADALAEGDTNQVRNTVWRWLLMSFFRYPQATIILFLLGFIAPGLISRDVRSRAFLLYFSRPIGRLEYMLGKILIPAVYIVAVTTLPALVLFVFAVGLSPNFSVLNSTWEIPFRIVLASVFLVIPTASLSLMLSSLTHESRFASFAWFAIWALGHGAWFAIVISQAIRLNKPPFDRLVLDSPLVQNWSVLSLYNNLGDIQSWAFGFSTLNEVWPGIVALTVITILSLVILFRRVSAPIRI
jgi:hypothetical protein